MQLNLTALSAELESAVENAGTMVVAVHGRTRTPSSGVFWRDGVIVTNEHSLKREDEVALTLPDGSQGTATLAGRDPGTDLAVLKTTAKGVAAKTGAPPKAGHLVLALGRSPNSGVNAAMGIVSAVSGPWRTWRGGQMDAYVRLDVTLFAGSWGGPVVTPEGVVIGVSTGVLSRVAPLAVPTATVDRVVDDLLSKGRVSRGFLGVGLQPVRVPEALRLHAGSDSGVIVLSVEPGGPADSAGVFIGDVLVSLNGQTLADIDDVQTALDGGTIGKQMTVKVLRGGQPVEFAVTVGERRA
ncbi:MAG: S1C family serine protease [Bryobacteraceae bacterium]